eukprot:751896-Hanusia_phi.AAC.2
MDRSARSCGCSLYCGDPKARGRQDSISSKEVREWKERQEEREEEREKVQRLEEKCGSAGSSCCARDFLWMIFFVPMTSSISTGAA